MTGKSELAGRGLALTGGLFLRMIAGVIGLPRGGIGTACLDSHRQ